MFLYITIKTQHSWSSSFKRKASCPTWTVPLQESSLRCRAPGGKTTSNSGNKLVSEICGGGVWKKPAVNAHWSRPQISGPSWAETDERAAVGLCAKGRIVNTGSWKYGNCVGTLHHWSFQQKSWKRQFDNYFDFQNVNDSLWLICGAIQLFPLFLAF